MSDFLDWPLPRQDVIVHEICKILEKHHIPYKHERINRPARSLTLMAPGCDAQALMAVYVEQDRIIDELRTELYKLRGMTKNEWKRKEPHDIITLDNGHKLLVLNNKPHSREYKRLMKEEAKRWKEYFDDFLIAMGDPNPALAIEALEKKWGVKL